MPPGLGGALLTVVAAIWAPIAALPSTEVLPVLTAGGLAIAHSLMTVRAAPINCSRRSVADDEQALDRIFQRFERWQAARAVVQLATFLAMTSALVLRVLESAERRPAMSIDPSLSLVIGAVVLSATVAAASLDQSIEQLPTRRRIGVLAYSDYSVVADARNGLRWYVPLAAAWVWTSVAAGVSGWGAQPGDARALALATMVVGVAAHILGTGIFAAPALLSQRQARGDEPAMKRVFDRFERWQTVRAVVDVATLAAAVWVLLATLTVG